MTGDAWPYCETTEALERAERRSLLLEIAGAIAAVAAVLATWQGLVWYGLAISAA